MTLEELYIQCDKKGIDVYYFPLKRSSVKGIALPDGTIAMDTDKISTRTEEKEVLAHELAHIETESFYNVYSDCNIKSKQERKAETHAIRKLVPQNELAKAIKGGTTQLWELAEEFEVSCPLMKKAVEYYNTQPSFCELLQ
ncbi:MAG: ImmA/IrrE family metallo-endopeptidase [Ruminococcus sp.]|nr:ImmA/IrrE family metallo-endopeptidase [Ruminococcus sp.]